VRSLLNYLCLRRLKTTMLDGKPLLILPERFQHMVMVTLSKEERALYERVESMSQEIVQRFLDEGLFERFYTTVLQVGASVSVLFRLSVFLFWGNRCVCVFH
jgi:SNF2 family DNA or RNA helicase